MQIEGVVSKMATTETVNKRTQKAEEDTTVPVDGKWLFRISSPPVGHYQYWLLINWCCVSLLILDDIQMSYITHISNFKSIVIKLDVNMAYLNYLHMCGLCYSYNLLIFTNKIA